MSKQSGLLKIKIQNKNHSNISYNISNVSQRSLKTVLQYVSV